MSVDQTTIGAAKTEEEKQAIYRLYYDIYISEYGYPLKADHANQILRDHLDSTATHYAVRDADGKLIGAYRVNRFCDLIDPVGQLTPLPVQDLLERVPRKALSYTSRVMVRKSWRGSTLIAKMATQFTCDLIKQGIRFDTCLSLPHLVGFYEQLGYRRYAQRVMQAEAGLEFPMAMSILNKQHFVRVRSPLSRNPSIRACDDSWDDGTWLAELARPWGTNHRLMEKKEFWDAACHALLCKDSNDGIFSGLSLEKAQLILKTSPILEIKAGDQLVFAGLHQENLFVILQGEFTLQANQRNQYSTPQHLSVGKYFGAQEFLNPGTSSVNAIAKTNGQILILDQVFLRKARLNHPSETEAFLNNITGKA